MTDNHQAQGHNSLDELDRALDSALAKYVAVQPREGLEERVLANLRAHPAKLERPVLSQLALAAASAVLVIAAALAWRTARPAHPIIANQPAADAKPMPTTAPQVALVSKEGNTAHTAAGRRQPKQPPVTATTDPKLDVFPSPRPLSEEELALAQYVESFPRDAKLVAQAQEASATEVLRKMQALADEPAESN
jgi:hypothetical protein